MATETPATQAAAAAPVATPAPAPVAAPTPLPTVVVPFSITQGGVTYAVQLSIAVSVKLAGVSLSADSAVISADSAQQV